MFDNIEELMQKIRLGEDTSLKRLQSKISLYASQHAMN